MLEIIYKDNFVTRGDSWRLHRSLIGSCCYNSQKSNFLDMRSSINELWMGADKVACGVVGETTKVYHFVYILFVLNGLFGGLVYRILEGITLYSTHSKTGI